MKRNIILGIIGIGCLLSACTSTNFQVETHINKDGSASRKVYALADSVFMAGDLSHNPFLFPIDAWQVERQDSGFKSNFFRLDKQPNVRISRDVSSIDQYSTGVESENPFVAPQESLLKRFRWFYTYYAYTGVFRGITDKGPIPIGTYLNKEEQALWFQGNMTPARGMNGMELKDALDAIGDQFWEWYRKSTFEISYQSLSEVAQATLDKTLNTRMAAVKDSVYTRYKEKEEFTPKELCTYLDEYLHTKHFSALFLKEGEHMETLFNEKCRAKEWFEYAVRYQMIMPGRLLSTNSATLEGDTLTWKIDAFRLMAGNYTLTAESRVCNTWAFIATFLLPFVAIGCFLIRKYKR